MMVVYHVDKLAVRFTQLGQLIDCLAVGLIKAILALKVIKELHVFHTQVLDLLR